MSAMSAKQKSSESEDKKKFYYLSKSMVKISLSGREVRLRFLLPLQDAHNPQILLFQRMHLPTRFTIVELSIIPIASSTVAFLPL